MEFLSSLKRLLGIGTSPHRGEELFVNVKIPAIPGVIDPSERASRFEDPLHEALERAGLGEVSGGGTLLRDPMAKGSVNIEYCEIDVDLFDAEPGLALLHRELARLQVPDGTVLEYERDGQDYAVPVAKR